MAAEAVSFEVPVESVERKKVPPEIVEILRRPLPAEAVTQHPTKPYLSSIKVIYMVERLNEAFGIGGWYAHNAIVEAGESMVVVKTVLTVPEYGIEIEQFGGNDNSDRGDAYKGACTDALSKIGSYLGIGMDVYKGLTEKPAPVKRTPVLKAAAPASADAPHLPTKENQEVALEVAITGCVDSISKTKQTFKIVNFHVAYDKLDHVASCWHKHLFDDLEQFSKAPKVTLLFKRKGKYLQIEAVNPPMEVAQPVTQSLEVTDEDYVPF